MLYIIAEIKPLREVIGHQNVTKLLKAVKFSDNPTLHRDTIKDCFIALITQDLHVIKRELDNLLHDINEQGIYCFCKNGLMVN